MVIQNFLKCLLANKQLAILLHKPVDNGRAVLYYVVGCTLEDLPVVLIFTPLEFEKSMVVSGQEGFVGEKDQPLNVITTDLKAYYVKLSIPGNPECFLRMTPSLFKQRVSTRHLKILNELDERYKETGVILWPEALDVTLCGKPHYVLKEIVENPDKSKSSAIFYWFKQCFSSEDTLPWKYVSSPLLKTAFLVKNERRFLSMVILYSRLGGQCFLSNENKWFIRGCISLMEKLPTSILKKLSREY